MKINWAMIISLLLMLLSIYYASQKYYSNEPRSDLLCYDGDSFAIRTAVDTKHFRLAYIDAPEKGEPNYKEATETTCNAIGEFLDGKVEGEFNKFGKDKYRRTLVELEYDNGISLNEVLILEGLAKPYYQNTTANILRIYNSLR